MRLKHGLLFTYLFFLVVYAGFVLLPKPPTATLTRFHVSMLGFKAIDLSIIVILAIIWYISFLGYEKLRAYSRLIKREKDGKQVTWLSRGLFFLALWLPLTSSVSAGLNYFALKHPSILNFSIIFNNYLNLVLPLTGFFLISIGARGLSGIVKQRPSFLATNILSALIVYVGLIYYHLIVSMHGRADTYHLSLWILLTTVIAPYVYMWFIGALSTYQIHSYQRKVAGVVYRKSWNYLAIGTGWLIVTSMIFQYLSSLTNRLNALSIYWVLAIVYALLAVLSVGFILIAIGARKLQRIEEV